MLLFGPMLLAIGGLLVSLPLPFAAWRLCVRQLRARPITFLAILASSLVSYFAWVGVYLSTRVASPPSQHSQFAGVDAMLAWVGFGVCHLITLAVVLTLAWRRPASTTPTP
jgi:hypothetical protein